jgi:uncharacterized protein (TIGR02001 family)
MNKAVLAALLAAAIAAPMAASAQQQRRSDWASAANASFVTDYRFRSISQTYRLPAVQAGYDLAHSAGFYAGTWGSNVSGNQFVGGAGMELDLYAGYKMQLSKGMALDIGFIHYNYPGAKRPIDYRRYDTTEIYAGLLLGNFIAKVNYSISDYFGYLDTSGTFYIDLGYTYPLSKTTNIVAHVGSLSVKNGDTAFRTVGAGSTNPNGETPNYIDYKLGVTTEGLGLTWGLSYIGNSAKDAPYTVINQSDTTRKVMSTDTIVFSIGKTF